MYDPKPLPKKALIAVPSAHAPFYPDNKETGLFISEALHPYNVFTAAGFEVTFTSETGEYTPDYLSTTAEYLSGQEKEQYENPSSPFRHALDSLSKSGDVNPDAYGIFFAAAGHAALIDYPHAQATARLAAKVYCDGGITASVCHGASLLPFAENAVTNSSIIVGKKVTGFTRQGEQEAGVLDTITRDWGAKLVDEYVRDAGAEYVAPPGPWDAFVQVDGRIVTGANPASATVTAEAAVKAFKNLENHLDAEEGQGEKIATHEDEGPGRKQQQQQ